jgi:hypothetical protein
MRFMFPQALPLQPGSTSAVTSRRRAPKVPVMSGNGVRFSERELVPSGQPQTSRLSRQTVDANASGGKPPAARLEVR